MPKGGWVGNSYQCGRPVGVSPRRSGSHTPAWPGAAAIVVALGRAAVTVNPRAGWRLRDLAVTQVFPLEPAWLLIVVCVVIGLGISVEVCLGGFGEFPSGTGGSEDVVLADEGCGVG